MDFERVAKANETLDIAFEISRILDTGLDRKTVSLLIALCENGVNPEVLCQSSPAVLFARFPPSHSDECNFEVLEGAHRIAFLDRDPPHPVPSSKYDLRSLSAGLSLPSRRWRRSSRSSDERRRPSERHKAQQHAELELCRWCTQQHKAVQTLSKARRASNTQTARTRSRCIRLQVLSGSNSGQHCVRCVSHRFAASYRMSPRGAVSLQHRRWCTE